MLFSLDRRKGGGIKFTKRLKLVFNPEGGREVGGRGRETESMADSLRSHSSVAVPGVEYWDTTDTGRRGVQGKPLEGVCTVCIRGGGHGEHPRGVHGEHPEEGCTVSTRGVSPSSKPSSHKPHGEAILGLGPRCQGVGGVRLGKAP